MKISNVYLYKIELITLSIILFSVLLFLFQISANSTAAILMFSTMFLSLLFSTDNENAISSIVASLAVGVIIKYVFDFVYSIF